jgi:hypothetical protein
MQQSNDEQRTWKEMTRKKQTIAMFPNTLFHSLVIRIFSTNESVQLIRIHLSQDTNIERETFQIEIKKYRQQPNRTEQSEQSKFSFYN